MPSLVNEQEFDFLLYEFLDTDALLGRPRYSNHSREVFQQALQTARRIAVELFASHNAKGDLHEPEFRDGTAVVIPETGLAWQSFAQAGFLSAHWDEDEGGLQMPEVILRAAMSLFFSANISTAGYGFLSIGAANLLRAFGSKKLKRRYLPPMGTGESSGTMCLTEPDQGSALGDIKTYAVPNADGTYRLFGQKAFISGGDQNITNNIVHMVLARIQGAPPGAKGISLFLVPKWLVDDAGDNAQRNDVALTGLLHKMGWHNLTSTILSFGEKEGAVGFLLGEEHCGLAHMFSMMNEARIGVGLMGASLAYSGFAESLQYARDRRQGRLPSSKDPLSAQVRLVDHADVRRMLLTQKAYSEGALALCLYASSLFEDQHSHPEAQWRADSGLLLDILTPIVKSWPARYGCVANDMAIQVFGGAGYIRDNPVEQLYRDQRLNPIHEGTEAIQALDLLGRKATMRGGSAFRLLHSAIASCACSALAYEALRLHSHALQASLEQLEKTTSVLVEHQSKDVDLALANATGYLDAFGRVVVAWIWLRQAMAACRGLLASPVMERENYLRGKLQATEYYFRWELPPTMLQLEALAKLDRTAIDTKDEWL